MRLAFVLVLLSACGGASPVSTPDSGINARAEYPAGPYGKMTGSVIANLEFQSPDGTTLALRDVFKDESNKLLLITTGAGWCTACIEEQPALKNLHTQWNARGLVILESLFENASFEPADAMLVNNWKTQYATNFIVVGDAPNVLGAYYDKSLAPMNMFVDLTDMKILRVATGYDANAIEAIITARLQ